MQIKSWKDSDCTYLPHVRWVGLHSLYSRMNKKWIFPCRKHTHITYATMRRWTAFNVYKDVTDRTQLIGDFCIPTVAIWSRRLHIFLIFIEKKISGKLRCEKGNLEILCWWSNSSPNCYLLQHLNSFLLTNKKFINHGRHLLRNGVSVMTYSSLLRGVRINNCQNTYIFENMYG